MLNVFGVAPCDLISSAKAVASFPPFSGKTVGNPIPVDCQINLLELSPSAAQSLAFWPWAPVNRGYIVLLEQQPVSVLKNHLRKIRQLQDEHGQNRVWPWFDQRYMKLALSELEGTELAQMFGPIRAFGFVADNQASSVQSIEHYQFNEGRLLVKQIAHDYS